MADASPCSYSWPHGLQAAPWRRPSGPRRLRLRFCRPGAQRTSAGSVIFSAEWAVEVHRGRFAHRPKNRPASMGRAGL